MKINMHNIYRYYPMFVNIYSKRITKMKSIYPKYWWKCVAVRTPSYRMLVGNIDCYTCFGNLEVSSKIFHISITQILGIHTLEIHMSVHLEEYHNRTVNKILLLKSTEASNNEMKYNVKWKCAHIESYAAKNLKNYNYI